MQLSHTRPIAGAVFDEPNLVSAAGLVALARDAGLRELVDAHLSVPTDEGANAGLKVASLVAGTVGGADDRWLGDPGGHLCGRGCGRRARCRNGRTTHVTAR
jgi:hypothetical protein